MSIADILITPAVVYHAPVGEGLPDESTIAYGTAWGGNWNALTYTKTPLTMIRDLTRAEIMVEQEIGPVKRVAVEEKISLEVELAEFDGTNLQILMEGTLVNTPPGAAQVGFDQLDAGGEFQIDEKAWGFEGRHVNSLGDVLPVRLFIHRATAVLNGNLVFGKAESTGIPIQIEALIDTAQSAGEKYFSLQIVTLVATA